MNLSSLLIVLFLQDLTESCLPCVELCVCVCVGGGGGGGGGGGAVAGLCNDVSVLPDLPSFVTS